jgi:hypothetical protein
MQVPRVGRVARFAGLLALASVVLLFGESCTDEGKAKVKAAVSSIASGGVPTPSHRPTPSARPSESPTETAAPIPSESSEPTESSEQSPSEIETTEAPTTEPSPTLSFSPSPAANSPSPTPTETATESASAEAASGSSSTWLWIVLALVVVAAIVGLALWARSRGKAAADWRSRARDPFSEGVVLHDRLKADLGAPQVGDDRLDESLTEVDRIGQQLNALTLDAPDDRSQQALAGLLMSLAAVRSALEEVRRATDPTARQSAVDPAQARVAEFERSLGSFRQAVWPQSTPSA